eukprot:TRINITY_DN2051_c0_g1_i1.p1 TRINITY_DN2051_c0_g1~~TRINITY_DN2051_c0_g1_i1.p1  ORF type:complete len:466 (-),score=89.35 TRINITY_DN2051_c0_g1_i1:95-1492(-)
MAGPIASLLSEFIGTFLLTFTAGVVALGSDVVPEALGPSILGFLLLALMYSFGRVSGGHFNPAVSLTLGLAEKIRWPQVLAYSLVQVSAAILGGYTQLRLYGKAIAIGPKPGAVWWEAMIVEILYTTLLGLVFLCVTSKRNHPDRNPNQFYGVAIGFALIASCAACGGVSGAALNPAVAIGLDVWGHSTGAHLQCWAYTVYQCLGAGLASLLFWLTHPEDYMNDASAKVYEPSLPTRLSSEFVGTFYLVLTLGLCTVGNSVSTAWAVAAVLTSVMYSFGDVSGGHFNPAVTLSAVLCRKIDISLFHGVLYACVQCIAGLFAGVLSAGLSKGRTFPLEPKLPYTEWAAYLLEVVYTALLALAVLSTGYAKGIRTLLRRNYFFGLTSGLVRFVGAVSSAKVSGGSFNPAVSVGIGFAHTLNYGNLYYTLSYSLAELIGGAVAVVAFAIVHAEAYRARPKGRQQPIRD